MADQNGQWEPLMEGLADVYNSRHGMSKSRYMELYRYLTVHLPIPFVLKDNYQLGVWALHANRP